VRRHQCEPIDQIWDAIHARHPACLSVSPRAK
jgi:hypothetical protein